MPLAMLDTVFNKWYFGVTLCDFWITLDVLFGTASILNLCAIALDRYWSITQPFEYASTRTSTRMIIYVAVVWIGALCVATPPFFIVNNVHSNERGHPICLISQNIAYQIYATLVTFYIPYVIMLVVYYKIFRVTQRISIDVEHVTAIPVTNNDTTMRSTRFHCQISKQLKGATILGLLVVSFTICWLPFFILAVVQPIIGNENVPPVVGFLLLWLGFTNSLINPIITVAMLREFRRPIHRMLCCHCARPNEVSREDFYLSKYGSRPSLTKSQSR